jgi:glutamine cyclotransferase
LPAIWLLIALVIGWGDAAGYPAFPEGDWVGAAKPGAPAPVYTYRVIRRYPHDPAAFTQGLVYFEGIFYEGTGLYGRSSLRRVDLETGQVLQRVDLADPYFGEGVAMAGDTLIQLTWREHTAFIYDRRTFAVTGQFTYTTEGWGLTHDGQRLIMSDGSNTLYFRDPSTFEETSRVLVFDGATPVARLNELEFIRGEVYANVWQTDRIARIDPHTGRVTSWIDLTGLKPPQTDVLNGIAYDAMQDRLFVTGKLWPYLYEIELVPRAATFLPLVARS